MKQKDLFSSLIIVLGGILVTIVVWGMYFGGMNWISVFVSFFLSVFSVLLTHFVRDWRERRRAVETIRREVERNYHRFNDLQDVIREERKSMRRDDREEPRSSYPILRSTGWEAYRGVLAREKPKMFGKIDDLYYKIDIVNTLIQRIRQIKWGFASSHEHSDQILGRNLVELKDVMKEVGSILKEVREALSE